MNYGEVLGRAWNIIWEHKYLILLGVLVALGSGGGSGGTSASGNVNFDNGFREPPRMPEMPRMPELPAIGGLAIGVVVLMVIALVVVGLLFWALSTIARGGLIAGANAADEGRRLGFGGAWNAGWKKGWRLLGIGIIPGIPGLLLGLVGVAVGAAAGGFAYLAGERMAGLPFAGVGLVLVGLACILLPLTLILGLLRTFANRACMLEDLGVIGSYRRGLEVLMENLGPAIVLFLIQIGIGIAIAVVGLVPGLLLALCCLLWPLLLAVEGGIAAYFSTVWTLAWRAWTDAASFSEPGVEEPAIEAPVA